MANTFQINIEYNGKLSQLTIPRQDYETMMKIIKEQLGIQHKYTQYNNRFILQEKEQGSELSEDSYLGLMYMQEFSTLTFILIEQPENIMQIGGIKYDLHVNPRQLLKMGLYHKYFRSKQIIFSQNPIQANKFDESEDSFVDIVVYGLKYYTHYRFVKMNFLQFLNQLLFHEKHNYEWVDYSMEQPYLGRCVEMFEFEETYKHATKDSFKYEIIRQNRIKLYCHYYFFSQICFRYQMETYKKLLNYTQTLETPNYQKCVLHFINCFIKDFDQTNKSAINEYFKPLKKPQKKNEDQFLKNVQIITQYINYNPPILDHNPNVGISLDENVKIDDVLMHLTTYWSPFGQFYDIHLTKKALYDAKYIIFLYNKYADHDLNIIIDSINFQLVQQ